MSLIPGNDATAAIVGLLIAVLMGFALAAVGRHELRELDPSRLTVVDCIAGSDTARGKVKTSGLFGPKTYRFETTDGGTVTIDGPCRLEVLP